MSAEAAPKHVAPPATVTVASVQVSSDLGDIAGNIAKITPLVEEAALRGAKFIVLPETAITGYLAQDLSTNWVVDNRPNKFDNGKDPAPFAEPQGGPSVKYFCELSQRLAVYITVPFLEREGNLFFNSVSLVGPDGSVRGHYRKTSPWPHPEQSWASAGSDVTPIDTEFGRVGLAICFDIHSVLAKYDRHKIWTLLYPIAWVGNPIDWFRVELPGMLRQVNCPHYIIGCNWSTDVQHKWEGAGISTHYGPQGELCGSTNATTGSAILYSTIFTDLRRSEALNLDKYAAWTQGQGVRKIWVHDKEAREAAQKAEEEQEEE